VSDAPHDLPVAVARGRWGRRPAADTALPVLPVFTPIQIALASIQGSFLAAGVLLALNYGLRRPRAAVNAVAVGALATAALAAGVLLPGLPWWLLAAIPFAPTLLVASILRLPGGQRASYATVVGVSTGSLLALIVGIGCASAVLHRSPVTATLDVEPRGHLEYSAGVSEMEARWSARVLTQHGYFEPDRDVLARLSRTPGGPRVLTVFFEQNLVEDDEAREALRGIAAALSREVFGGDPVDVSVHDGWGRERYALRWRDEDH
jgi:hypothetical protein